MMAAGQAGKTMFESRIGGKSKFKPRKIETGREAAIHLKGCKRLLVLTGAGLSAASGIPTFRGENGLWKKPYGEETNPMKILTKTFFK